MTEALPFPGLGLTGRRVTFVTEKLAERSGGAERVLIETANALADRGHQVEILSHEMRGKPPFYPLHLGVVHTNLRPQRRVRSRLRIRIDQARTMMHQAGALPPPLDRLSWRSRHDGFAKRLERHLDMTEPDVVVAFMPPAIMALSRSRPRKRPLKVASMHNAPEQDFENPERWDPAPYDQRRRLELMEGMDRILVLLPEYQDWYASPLRERVTVMPNAVKPVALDRLSAAERQPVIISVGRLAHVKRHQTTLRAFARLADQFPDWQLKIFGYGPIEAELEALRDELKLKGRAHLMGHSQQLEDEYLKASILAHPAKYEGFPLAVTEALSSGLPVVGYSDCSGLNRLVRNGVNGLLVEPGEPSPAATADDDRPAAPGGPRENAFTEALARLMGDAALRTRLGEGGPPSTAPYAPAQIIDQWEEVLFGNSGMTTSSSNRAPR